MKSKAVRASRVAERRRLVVRLGFFTILLATASACIFEQSDYQGGGRLGRAATAAQQGEEPPPEPTSEPTSTSTSTATSTSTPPPDSGIPGS